MNNNKIFQEEITSKEIDGFGYLSRFVILSMYVSGDIVEIIVCFM